MSKKINIEGKHLRWFVRGALAQYNRDAGTMPSKEFIEDEVDDTANKVNQFLISEKGPDASWSDFQCLLALEAMKAFGVSVGDQVEIYW